MADDSAPEFPNIAASEHSEDSFNNPRGYKIFTQKWLPKDPVYVHTSFHLPSHSYQGPI